MDSFSRSPPALRFRRAHRGDELLRTCPISQNLSHVVLAIVDAVMP